MKKVLVVLMAIAVGFVAAGLSPAAEGTRAGHVPGQEALPFPEIPRITKEEVRPMLGSPDVVIVDVRLEEQWRYSDQKIPGAVHENPMNVDSWAQKYSKDKTIVTY